MELKSTVSDDINGLSADFPLGSPTDPVAPPINATALNPARCQCINAIKVTRFPRCRESAVGSKPVYTDTFSRSCSSNADKRIGEVQSCSSCLPDNVSSKFDLLSLKDDAANALIIPRIFQSSSIKVARGPSVMNSADHSQNAIKSVKNSRFVRQTIDAESELKRESVGLVKLQEFQRIKETLERGESTSTATTKTNQPVDAKEEKESIKRRRLQKNTLSFGDEVDEDHSALTSRPLVKQRRKMKDPLADTGFLPKNFKEADSSLSQRQILEVGRVSHAGATSGEIGKNTTSANDPK